MKVGVLCERFGKVRDAFIRRGHDAVSCDIVDSSVPGPHITGDCLAKDWRGFDLLICHPPCTYLCNSGVCHLYNEDGTWNVPRWEAMIDGAAFFRAMLDLPCSRIAVENPIMHKHAARLVGRRQDQVVQPWMFGHGETKATCFWLKGLPPLRRTHVDAPLFGMAPEPGRVQRLHGLPPGPNRAMLRSETYQGIADAMAEQWGSL